MHLRLDIKSSRLSFACADYGIRNKRTSFGSTQITCSAEASKRSTFGRLAILQMLSIETNDRAPRHVVASVARQTAAARARAGDHSPACPADEPHPAVRRAPRAATFPVAG